MLQAILSDEVMPNLRKITMVMMEKGHTKFSPDTGFGLIWREEKNQTMETIDEVDQMIRQSTPDTGRNEGVHFEPEHFKKWDHHVRFKPIWHIRKQHLIQFVKLDDGSLITETR